MENYFRVLLRGQPSVLVQANSERDVLENFKKTAHVLLITPVSRTQGRLAQTISSDVTRHGQIYSSFSKEELAVYLAFKKALKRLAKEKTTCQNARELLRKLAELAEV